MVGCVEGFIELIPGVGATDVEANTGTHELGVAVGTEQILLISTAMNEDWQQQEGQCGDRRHCWLQRRILCVQL